MFHNNTESFVSENCVHCHTELLHTEEIFTDLETGNYVCEDCKNYLHINAVNVMEID